MSFALARDKLVPRRAHWCKGESYSAARCISSCVGDGCHYAHHAQELRVPPEWATDTLAHQHVVKATMDAKGDGGQQAKRTAKRTQVQEDPYIVYDPSSEHTAGGTADAPPAKRQALEPIFL